MTSWLMVIAHGPHGGWRRPRRRGERGSALRRAARPGRACQDGQLRLCWPGTARLRRARHPAPSAWLLYVGRVARRCAGRQGWRLASSNCSVGGWLVVGGTSGWLPQRCSRARRLGAGEVRRYARHLAHRTFPLACSGRKAPWASLSASTTTSPLPPSEFKSGSLRSGIRSLPSQTWTKTVRQSEDSHRRTGGTPGDHRPRNRLPRSPAEARRPLVTISETISSIGSARWASPHSAITSRACPRAQGTAVGHGPSSRYDRSGHEGLTVARCPLMAVEGGTGTGAMLGGLARGRELSRNSAGTAARDPAWPTAPPG